MPRPILAGLHAVAAVLAVLLLSAPGFAQPAGRAKPGRTPPPGVVPPADGALHRLAPRQGRTLRLVLAATSGFVEAAGARFSTPQEKAEAARKTMEAAAVFANEIFRRELGIELEVAGYLVYPPVPCGKRENRRACSRAPSCDPYHGLTEKGDLLLASYDNPDFTCFGDYDLGHVLTDIPGEGVAAHGTVCEAAGMRNAGATGWFGERQDSGSLRAFVHELAHQLGARHTFADAKGECAGKESSTRAVEPGSGSTLMSYAGACKDRLQPDADDYFHQVSLVEMLETLRARPDCGRPGPALPVLAIATPSTILVPAGMPFQLTARPGAGVATVAWEEVDRASSQGHPFFRSFPPQDSPARILPRPGYRPEKGFVAGESLPAKKSKLKFVATARDNRGGLGFSETRVEVLEREVFVVPAPLDCHGKSLLAGERQLKWPGLSAFACERVRVSVLPEKSPLASWSLEIAGQELKDSVPLVLPKVTAKARFRVACLVAGAETFSVESGEVLVSEKEKPAPEIRGQCTAKAATREVSCDLSPTQTHGCAITSYRWYWNWSRSAPGAPEVSGADPRRRHTYRKPGRYTVGVEVEDTLGSKAFRTFEVDLGLPNQPPAAVCEVRTGDAIPLAMTAGRSPASPPVKTVTGLAPETVSLRSLSSDPDDAIVRCNWDFGDGKGADGCDLTHQYAKAGTYRVRLRVWDGGRLHDDDAECRVVVRPNLPPVAALAANPNRGAAPLAVTFDASGAADPDDGQAGLTYLWSLGDGAAAPRETARPTFSHTYPRGDFTASVVVRDRRGKLSAPARIAIHADGRPTAAFIARPRGLAAPLAVAFDGGPSNDPEQRPLSFSWQFGDGGEATGPAPEHTYQKGGSYTVRQEVKDAFGLVGSAQQVLRVNGRPEVALTASPPRGTAPLELRLRAQAGDPDGDGLTFRWDFGDGSPVSETATPETGHRYAAGDFTASVTATDPHGAWTKATAEVHVNGKPRAAFTPNPSRVRAGRAVALDGSASSDDGRVVSWRWSVGGSDAGTGPAIEHTFPQAGEFDVRLEVEDNEGATDTRTERVVVRPLPRIEPAAAEGIAPLRLSLSALDVADPAATFRWRVDGGAREIGSERGLETTLDTPGVHGIALEVTDDAGSAAALATFTVRANEPPVPVLSPQTGIFRVGETVSLDASASSDPEGEPIFEYRWEVEGLASFTGPRISFLLAEPRLYRVRLQVTDARGATAEARAELQAVPGGLDPDPWYLCDHPEALRGSARVLQGVQFHRVYWQEQVWIRSVRYFHAIGMHPEGTSPEEPSVPAAWADFRIPAGARYFKALFGMAADHKNGGYGHVAGSVHVDGRPVWSGELHGMSAIELPAIPIPEGAKVLRLEVDSLPSWGTPGSGWADHATWADPRFTNEP